MAPEDIRSILEGLGAERATTADHGLCGFHVDATFPPRSLRQAVQALRDREFLIEDVTALDVSPDLMAVYHFVHTEGGCRTQLRVLTDRESPEVPSIQDIYPGANWHERETHDFYGLVFEGHPDLSPLILPEDAGDLNPLRKEGKRLKALGDVVPQFAPPSSEEEQGKEAAPEEKPAPKGEGEA